MLLIKDDWSPQIVHATPQACGMSAHVPLAKERSIAKPKINWLMDTTGKCTPIIKMEEKAREGEIERKSFTD